MIEILKMAVMGGPVLGLLGFGMVVVWRSGVADGRSGASSRSWLGMLATTVLFVAVITLTLIGFQRMAGFRIETAW